MSHHKYRCVSEKTKRRSSVEHGTEKLGKSNINHTKATTRKPTETDTGRDYRPMSSNTTIEDQRYFSVERVKLKTLDTAVRHVGVSSL